MDNHFLWFFQKIWELSITLKSFLGKNKIFIWFILRELGNFLSEFVYCILGVNSNEYWFSLFAFSCLGTHYSKKSRAGEGVIILCAHFNSLTNIQTYNCSLHQKYLPRLFNRIVFNYQIFTHWDSVLIAFDHIPSGNYLFKVNNRNTRTRCEICSKLTMKIFHTLF